MVVDIPQGTHEPEDLRELMVEATRHDIRVDSIWRLNSSQETVYHAWRIQFQVYALVMMLCTRLPSLVIDLTAAAEGSSLMKWSTLLWNAALDLVLLDLGVLQ